MNTIKLSQDDFMTGVLLEKRLAEAQAAMVATKSAYIILLDILRERYHAPAGAYELKDWAQGFVALLPQEEMGGYDDN